MASSAASLSLLAGGQRVLEAGHGLMAGRISNDHAALVHPARSGTLGLQNQQARVLFVFGKDATLWGIRLILGPVSLNQQRANHNDSLSSN